MTSFPRGAVKVVNVSWDQEQRLDPTTPYYWRVTFTIKLTNGWGITYALGAVCKCIARGEGGDGSWRFRINQQNPASPAPDTRADFDPNGGVQ